MLTRGLDVSHYQGAVNWKARRAQYNLGFAAAKCTEGTTFVDSQYATNRINAAAAGLPLIAYHYARPEASSAASQAARFVKAAGKVQGLCLDLEASQLSQSATNAWLKAFGDALLTLAPGVTTFAYLGGYASNGSGAGASEHFHRWWYPRYPGSTSWPSTFAPTISGNTTGWLTPDIWQFSPDMAGMDANVSPHSVTELFSGDDMLSSADLAAIRAAVWDAEFPYPVAGSKDYPAHTHLTYANRNAAFAFQGLPVISAKLDALPDAVLAKLPPSAVGGITPEQVKQAVKDALAEGVGQPAATS